MKQIFFYICSISTIYCSISVDLRAENQSTLPCTKEELMKFFPQPIVKNVLIVDGHLSEVDAEAISKELAVKDSGMSQLVDKKAAQYQPNPFGDPSQRDKAIKIYQEVLFEEFSNVLKEHGMKDEQQMRHLLDEIRSTKSQLFIDCIRQQQLPVNN